MASSKKPTPEEVELFQRSIGPVRKLRRDKVQTAQRPPAPRPHPRQALDDREPAAAFTDSFQDGDVGADEVLFFARPGVQQRLLQRLRKGKLQIETELDLHGMSSHMAREAVAAFLSQSQNRQHRCVRIIHGKGYGSGGSAPVLKNRVNNWLRQHHGVLAFCSARPDDGGTGAVYVLLRSAGREAGDR